MQAPTEASRHEKRLTTEALNEIFLEARTHNAWLDKPVPVSLLREAYDLARMGPTSANLSPARFVFLTTPEAKERLLPAMSVNNQEKTRTAPVNLVVAYDLRFHDKGPELFPHMDVRPWFEGNEALLQETAFRNGTLQAAYFIIAARALGLDCGPMSGFDAAKVDAEFFPDGQWKSNFVINLGYGDDSKLFPRNPRLKFEDACVVL